MIEVIIRNKSLLWCYQKKIARVNIFHSTFLCGNFTLSVSLFILIQTFIYIKKEPFPNNNVLPYQLQSNNNTKNAKKNLLNPFRITQVSVTFDVKYISPDDEAGNFEPTNLINSIQQNSLDDDQQMLLDIEQNIANLEKSFCQGKTLKNFVINIFFIS